MRSFGVVSGLVEVVHSSTRSTFQLKVVNKQGERDWTKVRNIGE